MPKNNPGRRLVSIPEAAEYFDVNPKTVRRWIAKGRLSAYRLGPRLIKVDLEQLDGMLQPIGGARR